MGDWQSWQRQPFPTARVRSHKIMTPARLTPAPIAKSRFPAKTVAMRKQKKTTVVVRSAMKRRLQDRSLLARRGWRRRCMGLSNYLIFL